MQDLVSINSQITFGSIRLIDSRIGEVVIHEGMVVDMEMMMNLHEKLSALFSGDFVLLLNEKNNHTYTVEAQKYLAGIKGLRAMAVLYSMRFNDTVSEYLRIFHEDSRWNLKIFYDRGKAIEWLETNLDEL